MFSAAFNIFKTPKSKLRTLYKNQDLLPKLIEDDDIANQRISDYYVKLNMIQSFESEDRNIKVSGKDAGPRQDQINTSKYPIEINDIFSKNARKILVTGKAGVGKTTLMHYISNQWGNKRLWNDEFEYVFRIRLKELTSDNWKEERGIPLYKQSQLQNNMFECFLHSCLGSEGRAVISLKDILNITSNKDKILLLVDGYDEITHLLSNKANIPSFIIDQIINNYPNIIMTSRPNAVGEDLVKHFNRIIENIGLDDIGIYQYVRNYFKHNNDNGRLLLQFLEANKLIKEICSVPINTEMICLIWSKEEMRGKLELDTNITNLYQEIITWLGRRYIDKFHPENPHKKEGGVINIAFKEVISSGELIIMKELAKEGFKQGKLLIDKELIQTTLTSYNNNHHTTLIIEDIDKYGLLRAEGSGRRIIDKDHYFIHLTFQEFLTALYLKEELEAPVSTEAVLYINTCKDDPRFLMILKFLSGLVTKEQKNPLPAIRFWEAIVAPKEQEIEIGGKKQIELLMHLLSQAKKADSLDARIPKKIIEYVNQELEQDIIGWSSIIEDTGYRIQTITSTLISNLDSGDINIVIKAIRSLSVIGFKDKQAIDALLTKINAETNQEQIDINITLEAISAAGNIGGGDEDLTKSLIRLLDTKDPRILITTINALTKSVNKEYIETLTEKFLSMLQSKSGFIDDSLIDSLVKILGNDIRVINILKEQLSKNQNNEIVEKYLEILKNFGIYKEDLISELLDNLNNNTNLELQKHAAKTLGNIASSNSQVVTILLSKINSFTILGIDQNLENIIIKALGKISENTGQEGKIAKILANKLSNSFNPLNQERLNIITTSLAQISQNHPELTARSLDIIVPTLSDGNGSVRKDAVTSLAQISQNHPELTARSLDTIVPTLSDGDWRVREAAFNSLAQISQNNPELRDRAFDILVPRLGHGHWWVREAAVKALDVILQNNPELGHRAFDIIVPKCADSNELLRKAAVKALAQISQNNPELAARSLDIIVPRLGDFNGSIREAAVNSLAAISQNNPELAARSLDVIVPRLGDSNEDVRKAAFNSLAQISQNNPELASKAFDIIVPRLGDSNLYVEAAAVRALAAISQNNPELAARSLDIIVPRLGDSNRYVGEAVVESLAAISQNNPELASRSLDIIVPRLGDDEELLREAAFKALEKISQNNPELALKAFDILRARCNDSDGDIRKAAVETLAQNIKHNPELGYRAFDIIVPRLGDGNEFVRKAAVRALEKISQNNPELGYRAFDILVPRLGDDHWQVRAAAVEALEKISQNHPELGYRAFDILVPRLGDDHWQVRASAVEALEKISQHNPDLGYRALDILVPRLGDRFEEVRFAAVTSLAQISQNNPELGDKAFDILVPRCVDSDWKVRITAEKAIETIKESLIPYLTITSDKFVAEKTVKILMKFYKDNLEELLTYIEGHVANLPQIIREKIIENIKSIFSNDFDSIELIDKVFRISCKSDSNLAICQDLLSRSDESFESLSFIADYVINSASNFVLSEKGVRLNNESFFIQGDRLTYIERFFTILVEKYNQLGKAHLLKNFMIDDSLSSNILPISSITHVLSLTNDTIYLETDKWRLSLLREENSALSLYIILLETRDIFGNVIIYKTDNKNNLEHYILKPYEINQNLKVKFFGSERLASDKIFYLSSYIINEQNQIYDHLSKTSAPRDSATTIREITAFLGDRLTLSLTQYQKISTEVTHNKLIGFRVISITRKLQEHDLQIQEVKSKVEEHDLQFQEVKSTLEEHSVKLKDHEIRITLNEEALEKVKQIISDLTPQIEILQNITISQAENNREIEIIREDEYKIAFYEALRYQLNSLYLASTVISSGMVANQQQETIGQIGSIFETLSPYVPLVGIGVNLLGKVLVKIDSNNQEVKIETFAKIVPDSNEMSRFAELIARKIAIIDNLHDKLLEIQNIEEEVGNIVLAIGSTIVDTLSNGASAVLEDGIASIIADIYTKIIDRVENIKEQINDGNKPTGLIDYAKRFIKGPEEKDDPQSQGETDANIIAEFIAEKIFTGEIKGQNKVESILDKVSQQYNIDRTINNDNLDTQNITLDLKEAQILEEEKQETSYIDDSSLITENTQASNYSPKVSVSPKDAIDNSESHLYSPKSPLNTNESANNINEPFSAKEFARSVALSLIESLENKLNQYNIKLSLSQKIDLKNTLSHRWVLTTKSEDWLILESASKDNEFRNEFIDILSSSIIEQFLDALDIKSIQINPEFIRKIIDKLKHENPAYSSNNEGNTSILCIRDIIYDNPLLNNMREVQKILTLKGAKTLSEILDEYEQAKIFSCQNYQQEQVLSIEDVNHASLLGQDESL